ncbi:MAG TPA: HDOD domain-containing protein, partial [Aeromonadales bacterium]|nr:HDOD domain-containing protein [Aeromonadales bacterium]
IENIKEAIVFLGLSMLRQWVSLLVLSSQKNKPSELMRINLVRAAFCRDLAQLLETVDADKAFLMGLISMIDAYLDFPLKDLLDDLPLSEDINQALLSESGILGDILSSVRHYEQADWPNLGQQQLAEAVWGNLYLGALNWADDTIRLIHAN